MSLTSRDDSVDLINKSRDSDSESVASGGDNNNNTDNSPLTTLVCPEGTLEGSEVSDDRQSDDRGSFFGASGANRSIPDNVNGLRGGISSDEVENHLIYSRSKRIRTPKSRPDYVLTDLTCSSRRKNDANWEFELIQKSVQQGVCITPLRRTQNKRKRSHSVLVEVSPNVVGVATRETTAAVTPLRGQARKDRDEGSEFFSQGGRGHSLAANSIEWKSSKGIFPQWEYVDP